MGWPKGWVFALDISEKDKAGLIGNGWALNAIKAICKTTHANETSIPLKLYIGPTLPETQNLINEYATNKGIPYPYTQEKYTHTHIHGNPPLPTKFTTNIHTPNGFTIHMETTTIPLIKQISLTIKEQTGNNGELRIMHDKQLI